jgi:hypothetical protein
VLDFSRLKADDRAVGTLIVAQRRDRLPASRAACGDRTAAGATATSSDIVSRFVSSGTSWDNEGDAAA